jgi:tRNA pseudouridine38-40 synthase
MQRTFRLLIAYDGTEFHGWQRQPGLRTVQGVLEESARRVCRHEVDLIGSGRTDAGVHAVGQAASLTTTCEIPPRRLRHALGARLPHDVSIFALHEARRDFHATRSAVSKLYRYRVHNVSGRPVEHLTQRYTYHFWSRIDFDRMGEAARHFVGTQDFTSMAARGGMRENMVRTVLRCDIERHHEEVRFHIEGSGFLYNQVRNMVGTLLDVGRGRWPAEYVREILDAKDRTLAGPTAPACGLCLQWVRYPPEMLVPDRGVDGEVPAIPPIRTEPAAGA